MHLNYDGIRDCMTTENGATYRRNVRNLGNGILDSVALFWRAAPSVSTRNTPLEIMERLYLVGKHRGTKQLRVGDVYV